MFESAVNQFNKTVTTLTDNRIDMSLEDILAHFLRTMKDSLNDIEGIPNKVGETREEKQTVMTTEDNDIVCSGTNDSSSHPSESVRTEDKISDFARRSDEAAFEEINHQREVDRKHQLKNILS